MNILDCTGGFARDAAILASLGNNITLIERDPLIMSLLIDANKKIKSEDVTDKEKYLLSYKIDTLKKIN